MIHDVMYVYMCADLSDVSKDVSPTMLHD